METYEDIYTRMKEKYEEESACEIDPASDIAIRLKVLAGEIYNAHCSLEWLKRQMYADTATGECLDLLAEQRGITRKAARKATGVLTFSVAETLDYPIEIPEGTVVATSAEMPIRVYTTEAAVLPQATYSVTVNAEAEQPGYNGNIAAGTAEIPVNVPAGIDAVINDKFIGGDDEESDESLRARIKDSYFNRPNPANTAYFKQLALSVDGIDKAGVIERFNSFGTVGIFVARKDYDVTDEALAEANRVIQLYKPVSVYAVVNRANHLDYDLNVTVKAKPGYERAEVIEKVTHAFTDYIGSLDVGARLYLSNLGQYLFNTGCIENYEFDESMDNVDAGGAQFFRPGDVSIQVI